MTIHSLVAYKKSKPIARLDAIRPLLVLSLADKLYWEDDAGVFRATPEGWERIHELFALMHATAPAGLTLEQFLAVQDYFSNLSFNIRMLMVREDLFLDHHTLELPAEYEFARAFVASDASSARNLIMRLLDSLYSRLKHGAVAPRELGSAKRPTIPHLQLVR